MVTLPLGVRSVVRIVDVQEGITTVHEFTDIYHLPRLLLHTVKAFMSGASAFKFKLHMAALPPYPSGCTSFKMTLTSEFKWTDKEFTLRVVAWPLVGVRKLSFTYPLYETHGLLFRQ